MRPVSNILIYAAFGALALLFFYPFLSGENILSFRDLSLYFYPLRQLMVLLVKGGQLPLWNPYIFCGYPLLATLQAGFFYPFSLLYYLLPFNLAFNYFTILHYFLAASFMFALLRHFGLSRASAFLSGVVFSFSGYLLSMANMNTTLTSVTWLPLVLLFFDKLINPPHPLPRPDRIGTRVSPSPSLVRFSLCLALMFLGGEPTILYLTFLMLFVYALVNTWGNWKLTIFQVGTLGVGLFIALALVAAQLLPFLETALHSWRVSKTEFAFIAARSFPPRELINFILPFFFGNLLKDGSYTQILTGDQHQIWLLSPYLGFFPLFFALVSFWKPSRKIIFFGGVAVFSLLLAFGKFTPFYAFFFHFLPGIALIRYPVKYIFLAVFSLSLLCGFGYEKIQKIMGERREKLGQIILALVFLCLAGGLAYGWARASQDKIFLYLRSFYPADIPPYFLGLLWKIIKFDLWSFKNLLLILSLGAFLFYLARKQIVSRKLFNYLMLAMVVVDLAANNISLNPPGAREVFKQSSPALEVLQRDNSLFRFYAVPPPAGTFLAFTSYNENLLRMKNNLTPNWLVPYRISSLLGRESMEPKEFNDFYIANKDKLLSEKFNFLNRANVKYILQEKNGRGGGAYLYRNPNCFPRAYIRNSLSSPARQANSFCEIIKYRENEIEIKVRLKKAGYLFLSDSYFPGWRVYVDRKEGKIIKADHLFRAVALNAGEHAVKFVYAPASFKWGAIISLTTFLGLIIAVIRFR
jgi:hypothetical protein